MIPELEEFARILVEKVRDAAIQSNDRTLSADHIIARRWKEAAASNSPEAFAKVLIPDIVDDTIAHFLGAIDQEMLRIAFIASNGKSLDLTTIATKSGEMSGWYSGEGGWIERYSKERFVDDVADLKDFFKKPANDNQQ